MDRVLRIVTLALVVSLTLTACDIDADEEGHPGPLPEGDPWPASAELTTGDEVPVYVMIDFSVDRGFGSGFIQIEVDGEPVVSGLGLHRPREHCNWYGPYIQTMSSGSHRVDVTLSIDPGGEEMQLDEMFDVSDETTLFVRYVDPSYDSDLAAGRLDAFTYSGRPGCD